jgi:hypothetical protein
MQCRHSFCYYCFTGFRDEQLRSLDGGDKNMKIGTNVPKDTVDPFLEDDDLAGYDPKDII